MRHPIPTLRLLGLLPTVFLALLAGCDMTTLPTVGRLSPAETVGEHRELRTFRLLRQFTGAARDRCLAEGFTAGEWKVRYTGYGCVSVLQDQGEHLVLRPRAASHPEMTHAALVVGPHLPLKYVLTAEMRNVEQLRLNTDANPWEAGWLVWSFLDDERFYYFIPKENGWELGKRDPAYPGGQRFLATGPWPEAVRDSTHRVTVTFDSGRMEVRSNGMDLVAFLDEERPYPLGRVALYTEDAEVHVSTVDLTW